MFAESGVRRNASHRRSIRWSRLLLLVIATVMGIVLVAGVILVLAAAITIDTFDDDAAKQNLVASPDIHVVSGTADSGNILGDERDARVEWESGTGEASLAIDQYNSNQLKFSTQSGVLGSAQVTWDGDDDQADILDNEGLAGEDLTDNGTNDGIQLLVYECDAGFDLRVTIYTGTNSSVYTLTISQDVDPPGESKFMPFSDFELLGGTGAVFTSAGAIVFDILVEATMVDLTIDLFESTANRDFGDLPNTYSTTLTSDGPRHVVGDLYLGSIIDREADGFPSDNADGDDNNNYDDEDGIERHPDYQWQPGNTVHITATVNGTGGYLVGWFDWNNDGDLADGGEMKEFGDMSNGENDLLFTVDNAYTTGQDLYARFRLYDGDPDPPYYSGEVTNGEVEDYKWEFEPTAVTLTRLDATSVPSRLPVGAAASVLACLTGSVAIGGALMRRRRTR